MEVKENPKNILNHTFLSNDSYPLFLIMNVLLSVFSQKIFRKYFNKRWKL